VPSVRAAARLRGDGDALATTIRPSHDLMTLTDVSRSADPAAQMQSAVALIRRFRNDKAYLPTQAGRLLLPRA
jgi:hypothetical protein